MNDTPVEPEFEKVTDADGYVFSKPIKQQLEKKSRKAHLTSFEKIHPEKIRWLWPGRIALGKLTIFAGDPGLGKSQGTLDVASRLSKGSAFPDGEKVPDFADGVPYGDTVILTSEDDPNDTIRPRLDALGADVRRVHFLKCQLRAEKEASVSLVDIGVFQDVLSQVQEAGGKVRLLIIDPLEGFLGGSDGYANAEVRQILNPLVSLASNEGFAILGIQHLNKSSGASASHRIGGSIAFTALARSVWIFCRDPNDENRRLFLCLKNNLGRDQAGLEYTIETASNGAPMIAWGGHCADDVRDVLAPGQTKRQEATSPNQEKVLAHLREHGPAQTKRIAEALGISNVSSVSNFLKKLCDKRLVENAGVFGVWKAVTDQKELSAVSALSAVSQGTPPPESKGLLTAGNKLSLPGPAPKSRESTESRECSAMDYEPPIRTDIY